MIWRIFEIGFGGHLRNHVPLDRALVVEPMVAAFKQPYAVSRNIRSGPATSPRG